ncbi:MULTISPECIES: endonuclease/exonuclease/phosphatase family protein [Nocardia]|uniref:endonuclease/exonuclease/phosphatase family protein n=1 Tax=Nocardia TaxID=1817 RepID=UPI000BEF69F6|nr:MULTISPECIES: endonuclease/exonuclease/phosphatase family protein [Nocardia]MBF6187046.1 endonuclease/exonuclease/phosphatase family protein [Nocardia farcinica]MBF6312693.1 endonuclease/exonuclease/phosphatase family protein [Nocardia farcinica]MBF6408452.1 endonuclease/exonuclease/phosphatase family protein [Nocardia farcinica]PEH78912.1 hypothetical protein CRM89_25490 [Nocardia sp. FDAARGOS_372]UEX23537.1 endonuclease/exonuclease/phosphatase family protein [Nocardia farcinica]
MDPFQGSLFSALGDAPDPPSRTATSTTVNLLALNVQSPSPQRALQIAARLRADAPDIIVLTELRAAAGSIQLVEELELGGYSVTRPEGWQHERFHVALASREVELTPVPIPLGPRAAAARISLGQHTITLVGAYAPTNGMSAESSVERQRWQREAIAAFTELRNDHHHLLVTGDLNVIDPVQSSHLSAFTAHDHQFYRAFASIGLSDVYVAKNPERGEYSWYSDRFGNQRLDHAFIDTELISIVSDSRYDHSYRQDGLSDHSGLLLTFEPKPTH